MSGKRANIRKQKVLAKKTRQFDPNRPHQHYYTNGQDEKIISGGSGQPGESVRTDIRSIKVPHATRQLTGWLNTIVGEVKPSTYESYYRCANLYMIPYFSEKADDLISVSTASQFVKTICDYNGLSESYKRKIVTVFKVALKAILHEEPDSEYILKSVKLPKAKPAPIDVFSLYEQRLIEAAARDLDDTRTLGIILCFYTGLRLGELCALQWGNINFETGIMSITKTIARIKNFQDKGGKTILSASTPKSRNSVRKIPVPGFLMDPLSKLRGFEDDDAYILTGSHTVPDPRTLQRLFKKILKQAGVKSRKFHVIRHTFATRALEAGIDVKTLSEILGHSSASITLGVYAHSLMEQKIAAINKLENLYTTNINLSPLLYKADAGRFESA